MKRVDEKVKDIVEVRSLANVPDFAADPAQTLAGYRFTDITADLMGKWLDAVLGIRGTKGTALALAGFRGVGKSHFLSALAAIASQPELRTQIPDQHVAAVAARLSRRHGSILFVHRGSQPTLLEEFRSAVADLLEVSPTTLGDSLNDLLLKASERPSDVPLLLLIDTAPGRDQRVTRDDGPFLSQIAETAKALGIFVGLALDDDIAGADGANLAISGAYTIDYLDQEHLYKIVDSHIFAKKEQALPLLREIYADYHDSLPGFRWSEQRFISLYPMHPATLEIAPLIRLYLQEFALLGFAAEAGVRILGRPANSLIGIDEIFDAVDTRLRNVEELKEAFTVFDTLDREVVGKTPVTLRLPVKLILKGLFMLSLDGGGATATEIAASMLVMDAGGAIDIPALLESFHSAMPEGITKTSRELADPKYSFKLTFTEDLKTALDTSSIDLPAEALAGILLRQAGEKYSDLVLPEGSVAPTTETRIEWRGALRHGEVRWNIGGSEGLSPSTQADWTVDVRFGTKKEMPVGVSGPMSIEWVLSPLTIDELGSIKALHVLQTDPDVRERFKERAAAETQIQALAVEKTWKRVFLTDGRLLVNGVEVAFSEDAIVSHTLAQLFGLTLPPLFEREFPEHPFFDQILGVRETAQLTAKFFGNLAPNVADVQKLAQMFAVPLGLARLDGEICKPLPSEELTELPFIKTAFQGLDLKGDNVIGLPVISARMGSAPVGLSREAQHLVLAALVAQRQIDFVTFSGNRINHRSLDLQILWDDIAGISKPFNEAYSSDRLVEWARLITGNSKIKSLDRADDRLVIVDTLSGWLANWKEARFLESFESLSDENLNSAIWRTATNLRKTFGALAEAIESLIQDEIPIDQCLHGIADLFSDSIDEYEKKKNDLIVLRYFTNAAAKRIEIIEYLALCEITGDPEIEALRDSLLVRNGEAFFAAEPSVNANIEGMWADFKHKYTDLYTEKHDSTMNSAVTMEELNEVLRSDKWSAFESFSDLKWFEPVHSAGANLLIRKARQMTCPADVRAQLTERPFCSCSFNLARFERRQDKAGRLAVIVDQGLNEFAAKVDQNRDAIKGAVRGEIGPALSRCLERGFNAESLAAMDTFEMTLLRSAIQQLQESRSSLEKADGKTAKNVKDQLPRDSGEWETEIDQLEVFANQ